MESWAVKGLCKEIQGQGSQHLWPEAPTSEEGKDSLGNKLQWQDKLA